MCSYDNRSSSTLFRHPTRIDPKNGAWTIAQIATLCITVSLIFTLVLWPSTGLSLLWNLMIPVLPASFLITPKLWRGICPLATLNQWSGSLLKRPQLNGRILSLLNVVGILLLVFMVPARRFLFNENGLVLAITITAVALAALILGFLFDRRAGFCNAVCPVLGVERIYGQHPLVKLDNHRCDKCTLCIQKGCLDLDPRKSVVHALGVSNGGQFHWLTTAYGILAAALPGFIVGYYTTANVALSSALGVYLWIGFCSAATYVATFLVVRFTGLSRPISMMLLAAVAVALYYWWAAALIAESLYPSPYLTFIVRGAAFALVAFWVVRAGRTAGRNSKKSP